jgi:replicative superfamily II helicase
MLQRPNVYRLESVDTLIVDECHMVERSPLESIINIFRAINPLANIIVMSGTIIPRQWEWLHPVVVNATRDRGITRVMVTVAGETDKLNAVCRQLAELEKPVIIFRSTKKLVEQIAALMVRGIEKQQDVNLPGNVKQNQVLTDLLGRGIGVHHGGLDPEIRKVVEGLYREGRLDALVSITTQSAGVNIAVFFSAHF